MGILKNCLHQSHDFINKAVRSGDVVIDATAGNGNDTLFLADLVGTGGKVYSFDIQDCAIENTRKKLEFSRLQDRVELIKDGHQSMNLYVKEKVKAVMFNLGYLPGGNHSIGTCGHTTVTALEKSMELLDEKGVISIVVYYGGDSGVKEKEQIMHYISRIDFRKFAVMKTEFVNQINCPPILVCIEKIR